MSRDTRGGRGLGRLLLGVISLLACTLVLAACGDDDDNEGSSGGGESTTAAAGSNLDLKTPGTLTVGSSLQFKPQAYLDDAGKPAGYDVEILEKLATSMGAKLKIENLDFNGLIPGQQAGTFDMVSSGLSPTPERKKALDFSRAYIPFALVLGIPADADTPPTEEAYNDAGTRITTLQGSTGEQLAKDLFPEAQIDGLPDQNAAFLEVATGRADGIVVELDLLAQFEASNPGELKRAEFPEPLDVQYGSWAVTKGDEKLVAYLDKWLCTAQEDGTLATTYKTVFKVDEFPPMPPC